ncbi:hypothetical protein QNI16_12330 [Cytophagaceae bacterium YF14B1]|uniref:Uncharacterized protein n=1 Tax=Xanthocytophaga flava TaxID=3048013 RepID=A0AAE3U6E3_9BACT|nr:hypothetical protein [Xanthocytophaga flavus]MDJ1481276.1 hypothetical protein [Xanthocytophaga flavus]
MYLFIRYVPAIFALSTFVGILSGCKEENISARTTSETIFTLQVKAISDPLNKKYVVVGDKDGNVLSYKELLANTTLTFNRPENYTGKELTITYVYWNATYNSYNLITTQQVQTGSEWTWDNGVPEASPTYSAAFQVTNVPPNVFRLVSSSSGNGGLQPGVSYPLTLYKTSENIRMRLEFTDNQPNKYYLLQNVQANKTYTVDLSAFETGISKTLTLKEPGFGLQIVSMGITRQNKSEGVFEDGIIRHPNLEQPITSFHVTYPNVSVDNFWLYAALDKDLSQSTLYEKEQLQVFLTSSSIPEVLPTLDADIEVQNTSAQNFQMTTIGEYDSYTVGWTKAVANPTPSNPTLSWALIGNSQGVVTAQLPSVPQELIQTIPVDLKCRYIQLSKGSGENTSSRTRMLK